MRSLGQRLDDLYQVQDDRQSQTYHCVVCLRRLDQTTWTGKAFPDYRCNQCHAMYADSLGTTWMRALENMARCTRMKWGRWRKRGVVLDTVSFEQLPEDMPLGAARRF